MSPLYQEMIHFVICFRYLSGLCCSRLLIFKLYKLKVTVNEQLVANKSVALFFGRFNWYYEWLFLKRNQINYLRTASIFCSLISHCAYGKFLVSQRMFSTLCFWKWPFVTSCSKVTTFSFAETWFELVTLRLWA